MRFLPSSLPLLLACAALLPADESTFDTAPDSPWTRFDPLYKGNFDFSGGNARLSSDPLSLEEALALQAIYGEAAAAPRVTLFSPSEFADTCVSVDLVAWNATTNRSINGQYHALFTRIQPGIAPGSIFGYGMAVLDLGNGNADLEINTIDFEVPTEIAKTTFPFNQASTYRLVFSSRGDVHTARVFDLASPAVPVAEIQEVNETYPSGRTGFGILSDRLTAIDATFDNFLTWDAKPCPVAIEPGVTPGTFVLVSDLYRAMGTKLETTTDLSGPWQSAVPASFEAAGGQLRLVFAKDQPRRFFRRKSL